MTFKGHCQEASPHFRASFYDIIESVVVWPPGMKQDLGAVWFHLFILKREELQGLGRSLDHLHWKKEMHQSGRKTGPGNRILSIAYQIVDDNRFCSKYPHQIPIPFPSVHAQPFSEPLGEADTNPDLLVLCLFHSQWFLKLGRDWGWWGANVIYLTWVAATAWQPKRQKRLNPGSPGHE